MDSFSRGLSAEVKSSGVIVQVIKFLNPYRLQLVDLNRFADRAARLRADEHGVNIEQHQPNITHGSKS